MKTKVLSILLLTLLTLATGCARSGAGRMSFVNTSDTEADSLASDFKKPYVEKFFNEEDEFLLPPPEELEAPEIDSAPTTKTTVPTAAPTVTQLEKAPPTDFSRGGIITPTIYYNPIYKDDDQTCKADSRVSLRDKAGIVLIKVCPQIAKECGLQGSCTVERNGELRLFNVLTRVNGRDVFFEMDREVCSYGYGVNSLCLIPYRSVAADLSIYRPGQILYIPTLRGVKLPNGRVHDGYLIVRDQGRGIKGAGRFDFFTGFSKWNDRSNPFVKLGLADEDTDMVFYLVKGNSAKKVQQSLSVSI